MFWKASERNCFQESIAGGISIVGVVSMSLARRNQKVGSPGCIELSVCPVRTTDDYVRVPPLNLPVLPVAHCSRPIVNDPAIHTHTHVSGGIWTPKEACRVLPLAICLDSCSCFCAWIRLLSWPFAQVSCLFMLRYPVNASALWPLSVSALSPVILPGVASLCLFFRSFS